ncbi:MAG: valine--tRNA ligase [Bacteroidales bacterium]|nr:valine--tRNA ligase [Bacteroidales bacterium]
MELAAKYTPAEVESKWYQYWINNGLFKSAPDHRAPYTIVIPPPNVTGILHMGHMLNNTIQDILVRRARSQGKNACWVPGTDHASIATEAKVVNKLSQQGIKKTDLSREQFLEQAWDWTHEHGGIILKQLRRLGASCDWDRTAFTMDDIRSESVIKVFCDLYNKGLIYRGVRMVNWDPQAQTALSDEEVIYKEQNGKLYYLRYKIAGEDGYAIVATTRPETIMGDTAMCINPQDPKNQHLKGKHVIVPLVGREIPVIEDEYVDIEFGTGCLKVTPAHDINDYMLGEKHGLKSIDIFNDNGTLNENGGQYAGMDRFAVRKQIVEDLQAANLLEKVEDYVNKVGFSERTNAAIEPKLSMQWFVKMKELALPALNAVINDEIVFHPAKFKNTYRHWMEEVKDWCISRQLWWGHRIPAYYLPQGGFVVAPNIEEALAQAKQKTGNASLTTADLRQEEDCLDTWFSSWLWPISLFDGINRPDNEEIKYYYPTADLVTAPDIIFFWVARMIMAGYEYKGTYPFKNVYFTGIVRDKKGKKMSKSAGNSPDPIELMDKYGADAVRMGMMLSAPAGNDILFDEALCEQGRNFNNKIWNAFRLVKSWKVENKPQPETAQKAVEWFDNILCRVHAEIDDLFSKYRLSEALMVVYKLFWDEFSAWYLEMIKPDFGQAIDEKTYQSTLQFFDHLLRLLHPFIPFITEELWQSLQQRAEGESIMHAQLPQVQKADEQLLKNFETIKDIITNIRNIRLQKNIPGKQALDIYYKGEAVTYYDSLIRKIANINSIQNWEDGMNTPTVNFLVNTTEWIIPIGNMIDKEAEIKKIEADIQYYEKFLNSVINKLNNEKFVNNAKPEIVALERKKQADATSKLETLKDNLKKLTE